MPTIKEKLEASSAAAPPWPYGNAGDPVAWHSWSEEHARISHSTEACAYRDAQASLSDVNSELNKARQERDKLQKAVDALEAKLKVAEHVVAILGSVEVP